MWTESKKALADLAEDFGLFRIVPDCCGFPTWKDLGNGFHQIQCTPIRPTMTHESVLIGCFVLTKSHLYALGRSKSDDPKVDYTPNN